MSYEHRPSDLPMLPPHAATLIDLPVTRTGDAPLDIQYDFGPLMEALIYYDRVLISMPNPVLFSQLVNAFYRSGELNTLIGMLGQRSIVPYYYKYIVGSMESEGWMFGLRLLKLSSRPTDFGTAVLEHKALEAIDAPTSVLDEVRVAAASCVIEEDIQDAGYAFTNANEDFFAVSRCRRHLHQSIRADPRFAKLGDISGIDVTSAQAMTDSGGLVYRIRWVVPEPLLAELKVRELSLPKPMGLLATVGTCVQQVNSAGRCRTDIWPEERFAYLVEEKLKDVAKRTVRVKSVVETLVEEVEFPSISNLYASQRLSITDVLRIRQRAQRFRGWLQSQGERDVNALIAYHNEVAEESRLTNVARKAIRVAGVVGGAFAGAAINEVAGKPVGPMMAASTGAVVSDGVKFLLMAASQIDDGWRPFVFGQWMKNFVATRNPPSGSSAR